MNLLSNFNSSGFSRSVDEILFRHPFIKRNLIGRSHLGKEILALEIISGEEKVNTFSPANILHTYAKAPGVHASRLRNRFKLVSVYGEKRYSVSTPKYFFNAAHHANEWITSPLLLDYIYNNAEAMRRSGASFYFVPLVNPDGADLVTGALPPESDAYKFAKSLCRPEEIFPACWKANAAGVDLNSNYPAGWWAFKNAKKLRGRDTPGSREYVGPYPLSEPESAALAKYTREKNFDAALSFHTQGEVVYWRYGNFKPPGAEALAEKISAASGYAREDVPDESAHAGYKDWFIQEFNRPAFTVECGFGENPLSLSQFEKMKRETAAVIDLFSKRRVV